MSEDIAMKTGDLVDVKTFSGEIVKRRIVEILRNTVYICTENEWRNAIKERRQPTSAGFNREYVVGGDGDTLQP
jgi:hypothetical protein